MLMISSTGTIPDGQLPLAPKITPAYAVAGVILIGTGVGYGFVGIKSRWVHSFMAAAYLSSLGTAILILYVMTPPVSNTIQGAYLVAIVVTGLILGGAALVFKEITECLGSLLGGFCLGMWLLTLGSGGVVHATGAKVGFILAFTLAAFATYFSRWTREYGLMACISFAGATAVVLGIDCFSRAGLKEFWAYLWDLNDHLFPLGADTYPLTRGIKVELAATILIFIAGMMSQLKIWRVIQKKRDQRERQRAQGREAVEREDLNIGQHVERMTHRERRQWERVYGDGAEKGFADSGVGSMGSDLKLATSEPMVRTSRVVSPTLNGDQYGMVEIPLDDEVPNRRRTVLFHETRGNRASVTGSQANMRQVGNQDGHGTDGYNSGADVPKIWVVGSDGEARLEKDRSQTSTTFSPQPEIVPLPFTVRTGDEDEFPDDGSSVAAYIDGEGDERSLPDSRRNSLPKRLSIGSGKILRSLSQRSKAHTVTSNEDAGESREVLVISRASRRDDNSSLAATLDDLSSDGRESDFEDGETRPHSDVERPLSQEKRKSEERSTQAWLSPAGSKFADVRLSTAETVSTRPGSLVEGVDIPRASGSATPVGSEMPTHRKEAAEDATGSIKDSETPSHTAQILVPSAKSGPAALKPEHLPRPLSRVALSYRTNEWAKHLSHAEAPESDSSLGVAPEPVVEEPAAPVDIEELQTTADSAARPVATPRSASAMSSYSVSRTHSKISLQQAESRNISPTGQSFPPQVHKNTKRGPNNRRTSGQILAEPIAEEGHSEGTVSRSPTILEEGNTSRPHSIGSSPSPIDPMQISASTSNPNLVRPPVPGVVSYSSPQTLIGKRELLLRNKSQASFYAPTPEPPFGLSTIPSSDAGSIHGGHHPFAPSSSRTSLENNPDLDDLPLSTRRQILRQSSLDLPPPPQPQVIQQQQPYLNLSNASASASNFDSHQPVHRRISAKALGTHVPSEAARQAQLASFRTSVQADLRHASSPFTGTASFALLPSAARAFSAGQAGWDRSVDQQRSFLLGQREAEAQRRETERLERERNDAEFEERMRRGELLEAHRDAMRRLQGGVRDL